VLATCQRKEGNLEEARRSVDRAIAIKLKAYGPVHETLAIAYVEAAAILLAMERLPEARAAAEQALAIHQKTIGESHPDYGESLRTLADVLRAERRFKEAVRTYQRALALYEAAYGGDSTYLLGPLVGTCEALVESGDAAGAAAAAERAVSIAETSTPDAQGVAQFCLAKARFALGDDRAVALAQETRAKLSSLGYAAAEVGRIDRWLARVRPR
jgi:tetratricopeptide (TPR) repeat protein